MNDHSVHTEKELLLRKSVALLPWLVGSVSVLVGIILYVVVFPPLGRNGGAPQPVRTTADISPTGQLRAGSSAYFLPARFQLDSVPVGPEGELIRYGHELIAHTPRYLGPQAEQPLLRLAGSDLACQNCHLQAGQKPYAAPYVGIWGIYPTYKGREDAISSLEDRINGCMTRSLNGRALPLDGREMKALLTYMKWLSRRVPVGEKVPGQGFVKFTMPNREADLSRGQLVFARQCASCHGADGQGTKAGTTYLYPPLWGPHSFNDGAGMHRLQTAARFVKANMPFGATATHPLLSDEEAYDVAAYFNSMPRPHLEHLDRDYPNRQKKPVDCPYPPYADHFSQHQHQFGPFAEMAPRVKSGE